MFSVVLLLLLPKDRRLSMEGGDRMDGGRKALIRDMVGGEKCTATACLTGEDAGRDSSLSSLLLSKEP